jgi:hypothetical protein
MTTAIAILQWHAGRWPTERAEMTGLPGEAAGFTWVRPHVGALLRR